MMGSLQCFMFMLVFVDFYCAESARWVDLSDRVKHDSSSRSKRSTYLSPNDVTGIGSDENLEETDTSVTKEGTRITRYRETYKGIPIYGAYASLETDQTTGTYTGQAFGKVLERIVDDLDTTVPAIDKETGFLIALKHVDPTLEHASHVRAKKVKLVILTNSSSAFLAYDISFSLTINDTLTEPGFFVDAKSGMILKFRNRLRSVVYEYNSRGGNKKNKYVYNGKNLPDLHVERTGNTCKLKSENVRVLHLNAKMEPEVHQKPYSYECNIEIHDDINGAYSQLSDAFFFAEKTFQMYKEWSKVHIVSRPPIDIWVHYGKDKIQASFNGEDVVFGDGDRVRFYPMVSADTMAHELSHAFTDEHSAMEYEGESGALTESFSDIAGESLEYFVFGKTDFLPGANITIDSDRGVRDICNQAVDGRSVIHVKDFKPDTKVHYGSGIFNKVGCSMFKSEKLGVKATFQIFVHANQFYWYETVSFNEGGCGLLRAAYDLGHDVESVKRSLESVGVKPCDITLSMRTVFGAVEIQNLSASRGEEISFRVDFDSVEENIARIKVRGGSGDADLFYGTKFPLTSGNVVKAATLTGNKEKIKLRTSKCKVAACFITIRPKTDYFANVTLKVDLAME